MMHTLAYFLICLWGSPNTCNGPGSSASFHCRH